MIDAVETSPPIPEQQLGQLTPRAERYRLRQFFTPGPIAGFMATAVNETRPETCLEPGVGGGALLRAGTPFLPDVWR